MHITRTAPWAVLRTFSSTESISQSLPDGFVWFVTVEVRREMNTWRNAFVNFRVIRVEKTLVVFLRIIIIYNLTIGVSIDFVELKVPYS